MNIKNTIKNGIIMGTLFFVGHTMNAQSSSNLAGKAFNNLSTSNSNFTTVQNTALQDAYLNTPEGIAIDTNGRAYFTHWHRIMLIDGGSLRGRSGGAGDPSSSSGDDYKTGIGARFSNPRGVAVDPNTNEVYICDYNNRKIRKLSAFVNVSNAQINTHVAGTGTVGNTDGVATTTATFEAPYDIVAMANGDLYVSDDYQMTIRKISGGMVSTVAGAATVNGDAIGAGSSARFQDPMGLCKLDESNILICDYGNGKIKQLNVVTNTVTTVVSGLTGPRDVEYINGVIYFTASRELKKYENGTVTTYAGANATPDTTFGTLAQTRFGDLRNLAYHKQENALYVVDNTYGVIKRVLFDNTPKVDFSATPLNATVGQVVTLSDLTTDRAGTRIWEITPSNYNLVGGTTLISEKPEVEFTQTGSYSVKLTYNYGTGSIFKEKVGYINVSNVTATPVTDFKANKTVAGTNSPIIFTDLSSNTPTTWLWEVTPSAGVTYKNSTTSGSKFPEISFANEGKYTIKLTTTNATGSNAATKTNYINIDNSVDVKKIEKDAIFAYPNPVTNTLNIAGLITTETYTYSITNISGQLTLAGVLVNNTIDVKMLETGVYVLVLNNIKGESRSTRIKKD